MSLNDFFDLIEKAGKSWLTRLVIILIFGFTCMIAASDRLYLWELAIPATLFVILAISEWNSRARGKETLTKHDKTLLAKIQTEMEKLDIKYVFEHDFLSSFFRDRTDQIANFYLQFPIDDERFVFTNTQLNKTWSELHYSMREFYETLSINTNILPHNTQIASVKRDEPWSEETQRQERSSANLINKAANVMQDRWNKFHSMARKLSG